MTSLGFGASCVMWWRATTWMPRGGRLPSRRWRPSTIHTRAEERASASVVPPVPHNGATWVTRQNVYVDRIASAWLIARFIDRGALFKFVPARGYQPAPGELRFDMFEGEYTHEGDRCTFETLLRRFALDDAALDAIAGIVHDIDMKDDKFERDETDGVQTVLEGIARGLLDDDARLTAGRTVFDGLYEHFRHHA